MVRFKVIQLVTYFCIVVGYSLNKTCLTKECTKTTMACPPSEPHCRLQINCIGYKSCQESVIDCTTSTECVVHCSDDASCDSIHVLCPAQTTCNVNCISEQHGVCSDIIITGNAGTITNVKCQGEDACYAAQIDCQESSQCNLACYGERACSGPPSAPFNFLGQNSDKLKLSDCIAGSSSCQDIHVFCPSNGERNCWLPGGGVFSERPYHESSTAGGIYIYAVHSWHDVLITDYDANNVISGAMFCGQTVDVSCNISNENGAWDCTDDGHLCASQVYVEPTMDPTLEPTIDPTADPTMNPTTFPSTSPSLNPSMDPTHSPTMEPTAPTAHPTTTPSTEPTAYPTSSPTKTRGAFAVREYGLLVAIGLIVFFVALIFCVWRFWKKGNSVVYNDRANMLNKQMQLNDDSDSADDQTMGRNKKSKKRQKNKNPKKKNDSDYQKQTDDPFETNQWTELSTVGFE